MGKRTVELEGPRWLVLLLDGVRDEDVAGPHTPHLRALCDAVPNRAPLHEPASPSGAVDTALFDALPLDELAVRGLQCDRRSWSLRPDWQCDRAAVDGLARRPRGRPDVSFVWLRDVGRTAARCGLGSAGHRQALCDLDAMVLRVAQMQARGEVPPQVIALTFASPVPVRRTFDVATLLGAALPKRTAATVRCVVRPDHLRIAAASMHDREVCSVMLSHAPFRGHGRELHADELARHAVSCRPDEIVFVPHEATAFGASDVRAARRFEASPAAAWLPWSLPEGVAAWTAPSIAAHLTTELRRRLTPIARPATDTRSVYNEAPDLLSVFDPELRALLDVF